MKFLTVILVLFVIVMSNSCSDGQNQDVNSLLSATQFESKAKELPSALIIDVRTPGEFAKGRIEKAINIDINNYGFESEITKLDKTKPIFVYCLSGSRSAYAAKKMKSIGFVEIYDLDGGMIQWRRAGLKETTGNSVSVPELSKDDYDKLVKSDKLVLIDFYAEWCAPCKKMAPFLEELKNEMADKIVIVRINADDNKTIAKELKVEGLPTLLLYKKKAVVWSNLGFINKEDLSKQIKANF